MKPSAPASPILRRRSAARTSRAFPRRSPVRTGIANSSSGPSLVERLAIDHVGHRGDGVAQSAAGPIYVPYTLPGEVVEVDPWPGHPDRRNLLRVEAPSAERIDPVCPHFGVCGGCALQHWSTARYRDWKRALIVEALTKVGLEVPVEDPVDAH